LPLLGRHAFTFLIEDPATVWHLGPARYKTIAERYEALTPRHEKLAIDVNIVERYQNVYPTKQQTGTELLQLIHEAAVQFARVAVYFESSLQPVDLSLLPSAAATVTRIERLGAGIVVHSVCGIGLPWQGDATVDGQAWPVSDGQTLWVPAGAHVIESISRVPGLRLMRLNGDLKAARLVNRSEIEFSYESGARAIALFDRSPQRIEIDGAVQPIFSAGPTTVLLPPGQHIIRVIAQ
jgi:hypothetical protein